MQFKVEASLSAGILPISTVGQPGAQGAGVIGRQGMGVSTPNAAAVAALTIGLAIELHMAKGGILRNGMLSIILAAGMVASTRLLGRTIMVEGAAPKLHCIMAPLQTRLPIDEYLSSISMIL